MADEPVKNDTDKQADRTPQDQTTPGKDRLKDLDVTTEGAGDVKGGAPKVPDPT